MAPQFTGTKALAARRLCWWMWRANTSLPVPVSPVSSTVASLDAIRSQERRTPASGESGW